MTDLPLPRIDSVLCSGCGRCIEVCLPQALALVDGKAVLTHPERCTRCALCEDLCPEGAIALPFLIVFAPAEAGSARGKHG